MKQKEIEFEAKERKEAMDMELSPPKPPKQSYHKSYKGVPEMM